MENDSQFKQTNNQKSNQGSTSQPSIPEAKHVIFHGKTGEYFAIWIVNVLLSIITLGIYSAWAKVRTQRYFNGNTEIEGHRFSYLAQPLQILKGRVIALLIFAAFYLISSFSPMLTMLVLLIYFFAVPWFLCQSFRFNMRMTAYRNIRFNFHGQYIQAFLVFMIYPILSVFTLYLAMPLVLKSIDKFIYGNMSYGDKMFTAELETSLYYKAAFGAVFIAIAMFVAAITFTGIEISSLADPSKQAESGMLFPLVLGVTYLAVFIISGAFYSKVVRNHLYEKTQVENIAMFKSTVTFGSLVWLNFSNLIILICSVGLALPYVKIRRSLYFCQVTHVTILSGMEDVIADQSTDASSVGDEVSEIFDFDVAIG